MTSSQRIEVAAVLFDSDGVLVDSHRQVEAAWLKICERYQIDAEQVLKSLVGVRAGDTLGRFLDGDRLTEAIDVLEAEEISTADVTLAINGATDLVASLPHNRYAFVTSAAEPLAGARWRGAGIVPPPVVITAEDVTRGKPDPEPYLTGAHRLGVAAKDCLVFEDSASGGEAARRAGAVVVAVGSIPWSFEPQARIPDLSAVTVSTTTSGLTIDLRDTA